VSNEPGWDRPGASWPGQPAAPQGPPWQAQPAPPWQGQPAAPQGPPPWPGQAAAPWQGQQPAPGQARIQGARVVHVEQVPGTGFGLAYLAVTPTVSGLAVGGMIAGIGAILISILVYCFGLGGAQGGWGVLVSGAFAILAALIGAAAVGVSLVALRQIRRMPGEVRGRGLAVSGIACGGSGLGLTVLGFLLAVLAGTG
jgi:hypothetical protein